MTERMNHFGLSLALAILLAASGALPASSSSPSLSKHEPLSGQSKVNKPAVPSQESAGERKFNQNCARCHKAPQGFPPSISGTVLKHMRVRASLSEQDERDILKFLNP